MNPYQVHSSESFNKLYDTKLNDNMSLIQIQDELFNNHIDYHTVSHDVPALLPNDGYTIKVNDIYISFLFRKRSQLKERTQ